MKKKLLIVFLIIILAVGIYKGYSWYSDNNLMKKTKGQLKSLIEPYINHTIIVINDNKYILRTNEVKLGDNVRPYKNRLNSVVYVNFDIYKDESVKLIALVIEGSIWKFGERISIATFLLMVTGI